MFYVLYMVTAPSGVVMLPMHYGSCFYDRPVDDQDDFEEMCSFIKHENAPKELPADAEIEIVSVIPLPMGSALE